MTTASTEPAQCQDNKLAALHLTMLAPVIGDRCGGERLNGRLCHPRIARGHFERIAGRLHDLGQHGFGVSLGLQRSSERRQVLGQQGFDRRQPTNS